MKKGEKKGVSQKKREREDSSVKGAKETRGGENKEA